MEANQKKNISFTRCLVNDKVCGLYIDKKILDQPSKYNHGGEVGTSDTWASPYILYSLEDRKFKDMVDVLMTKQVRVSFTIGEYEDEVLCGVVAYKTRDLLLGLP
jgi:hypothetical protein